MINFSRKERIKSSPCDPYKLGYTRATMKITKRYIRNLFKLKLISKNFLSSDYKL